MKKIKAGTMLSEITFSNFPMIAKNSGLDFVIIDNEHGAFDHSAMASILMNANLVQLDTVVRLGNNGRESITRLADMGAGGFLLPMTNCAADIAQVVTYAKYAPIGKRGVSTTRAHTFYNPPSLLEYMKTANEKMQIYAQIETKEGLGHVEEILGVEGVSGIFIGPNDLSVDLGCVSQKEVILECIERISSAARTAGKVWGIITKDKDYINCAKACGVDCISYGSELNMLIDGCKKIAEKI